MPKYSVECNAPTPLTVNPFEVEAEDEASAVEAFKAANGIVDSDHAITATMASEVRRASRRRAAPAPVEPVVVEPVVTEPTGETTEEADEPAV